MSRSTLARAALAYADRFSWPVFPLVPRDKIPLISRKAGGRGCLDATTDLAQIESWWRQCPAANIGIALGEPCGDVFAVDIDPRNEGDAEWYWLQRTHGVAPETVTSVTGSHGLHALYRGAASCTVVAPGVDIKSSGGYVVAPPSVHPNGRRYLWEASGRPDEIDVAAAPQWLLDAIGTPRGRRKFPEHEHDVDPNSFALGAAFGKADWLGPQIRPGVWAVLCPNDQQHSSGRDYDTSTVIFAPVSLRMRGRFFCSHEHCRENFR